MKRPSESHVVDSMLTGSVLMAVIIGCPKNANGIQNYNYHRYYCYSSECQSCLLFQK